MGETTETMPPRGEPGAGEGRVFEFGEGIVPRDLRFGIREAADPAWFAGDPVLSALVDGFAVMLPAGERFFIKSLRHYVAQVDDPEVQAGIRGYAVQEAYHTREHEAYNDAVRSLGGDVDRMDRTAARMLDWSRTPLLRLASTCAIEQITYAFSRFALGKSDVMGRAAPAYRRLWRWHALEEVEHAAVALRVYHAMPFRGPRWVKYVVRVVTLHTALMLFIVQALRNAFSLLRARGLGVGPRVWLRILRAVFVWPGFGSMAVVPYFLYLRPGYRGGGPEDAELVARGRRLLREDGVTA